MKPRLRDYLTISMALLAIFLSGYGLGFIIGEKEGSKHPSALSLPGIEEDQQIPWEERTLSRLDNSLKLSPEQREAVKTQIDLTSAEIQVSRNNALKNYYQHLLNLHDQLAPHLDPKQMEEVQKHREQLRRSIELRFPSRQ